MSASTLLCRLEELPDGGARGFDPEGTGQDSIFVVRQGDRLFGYRDQCPHYGDTPMAWRRHAYLSGDGRHIVCAAHGALFRIADGACIQGPCLGQSLTAVPLCVDNGGEVRLARGCGRPRAADVEPRAQELIDIAAGLFLAQGYAGTSLQAIAREARVAVRTIYNKFGGKLGLFEAVVAAECARSLEATETWQPGARPLAELLADVCSQYLALVSTPRAMATLRMVIGESAANPQLGQVFHDAGPGAMRKRLIALFAHPDAAAVLRPGPSPEQLASFLLSCLLGDTTQRLLAEGHEHGTDTVQQALAAFFAVAGKS